MNEEKKGKNRKKEINKEKKIKGKKEVKNDMDNNQFTIRCRGHI